MRDDDHRPAPPTRPAHRVAAAAAVLLGVLVLPGRTAHADPDRPRARRERGAQVDLARPPEVSTLGGAGTPPVVTLGPPERADAPRQTTASVFDFAPAAALAPLASRPGGVLVADRAIAIGEAGARGATWSIASLATGETRSIAAPVRVVASSSVGVLAENVRAAGDVLIAHDGERALVVHADGSVARSTEARGLGWILGAAASGSSVIVWWRLDATRTELEALDPATARTLWRRPGPAWSWDARLVAAGAQVALSGGGTIELADAATGTARARFEVSALLSGLGWPHPIALDAQALVVAAPGGAIAIDVATRAQRALSTGLGNDTLPSLVAARDGVAYLLERDVLVAIDLATAMRRWARRVGHAGSLHVVSAAHLVVCDGDRGAIVVERATGAAALRVGVGGCEDARARADGTIAIAGARGTFVVGAPTSAATSTAPLRRVAGVVTLDGVPAAGLPVVIGAASIAQGGHDGCPPLPPYARCVRTDAAGRFVTSVRAHGWLPIAADAGAAARRAGRPRALGGFVELPPEPTDAADVQLDLTGADEEL